ncbi:MAG: efflux RND transporter periplasmic adaptor subunit [Planctomycetales bacterium]|nr:efflux RND transporter periplasmic adaptor subunit [Planctomycetales bacterium]
MSAKNLTSQPLPPAGSPPPGKRAWLLRRIVPVGAFLAAGILLIISVGLAQRFGWIARHDAAPPNSAAVAGTTYTCPMHPQIRQPTPGRCPICGMELVPASSGAADIEELAVKIEPAQRRLANIQTATVESGPMDAVLQSVGMIAIDESRQATIAAYIDGRMERLFADYTGVDINKGDHLAVIYSPQLYGAQVEYVEARRALGSTGGLAGVRQAQEALAANTRQRLREFGMTDEQLSELETSGQAQSRLTIYAPQGGTVVEKLVVEGSYVKAGDPIYRIAELTTVWLMLKLFPEDAGRIRFGQRVEATVQSSPGEMLEGRVAFIDPTVDPKTRTVGVRVELMNEQRRLRPGDYAEARITLPIGPQGEVYDSDLAGKWISPMHPQIIRPAPGQCPICGMDLVPTSRYGFANQPVPQPASLSVPRSAVLLAGGNSVVYVETQPGRFEIRPVKVGPILRDKIIILEGLKAGENVATAGNFLIDSQMQLAGKPSLIDPTRAVAASQKESEGPLQIKQVAVAPVVGETGKKLEVLYAAYFDVQKALAADKTPPEQAAQNLHRTAKELAQDEGLSAESRKLVGEVAAKSEHLHHLDLKGVRKEFKPISHAVVTLAAQARAADAAAAYVHFYCPMVPGGGGDWLQPNNELLNPYWGGEMLRCGDKVNTFSPPKSSPDGHGDHGGHQHGAAEQPRQVVPQKTETR